MAIRTRLVGILAGLVGCAAVAAGPAVTQAAPAPQPFPLSHITIEWVQWPGPGPHYLPTPYSPAAVRATKLFLQTYAEWQEGNPLADSMVSARLIKQKAQWAAQYHMHLGRLAATVLAVTRAPNGSWVFTVEIKMAFWVPGYTEKVIYMNYVPAERQWVPSYGVTRIVNGRVGTLYGDGFGNGRGGMKPFPKYLSSYYSKSWPTPPPIPPAPPDNFPGKVIQNQPQ